MNKVTIIILSLTLATVVGLAGAVSCSGVGGYGPVGHVVPYIDKSFTVEPLHYVTVTVDMRSGAVFEGYLTVRGGNDDVRFYIKDSYGNKVLDINRVQGRYDFSYRATSEGFHTIYFDNSFSLITSKQVYLHYRVR